MSEMDHAQRLFASYAPSTFEYHPDSKQFQIGQDSVALNEYATYVEPEPSRLDEAEIRDLIGSSTLLIGVFERLYQMPTLYEWLKDFDKPKYEKINDELADVMIDAFVDLTGQDKKHMFKGNSHWDFGMGLYRPGHPVFRVIGDCACFGVDPHGMIFREESWSAGFSEYSMHNVDSEAQKISLLAGAGTLASMCAIECD